MSAYVLVDIEVTDAAKYDRYKTLAETAIKQYGGRYVVRGGETRVLEGDAKPHRVVVLEFPDLAGAQRFYDSPEYGAAREARAGAARMKMIAVQGL